MYLCWNNGDVSWYIYFSMKICKLYSKILQLPCLYKTLATQKRLFFKWCFNRCQYYYIAFFFFFSSTIYSIFTQIYTELFQYVWRFYSSTEEAVLAGQSYLCWYNHVYACKVKQVRDCTQIKGSSGQKAKLVLTWMYSLTWFSAATWKLAPAVMWDRE